MPFKTIMDRLSSPIAGPFMISWCGWNWKVVLIVITSGLSGPAKINEIENLYSVWFNFVLPFIFAGVYIFGMPWLIIKFGEFENYCKRLIQVRDAKEELKIKLEHEIHYKTQYELFMFLFNSIDDNRRKFKSNAVNLKANSNNYLNVYDRKHFLEIVDELNKCADEITRNLKETEELFTLIAGHSNYKAPNVLVSELKNINEKINRPVKVPK